MQAGFIPNIRDEAKEFWEGINQGEFRIQRCTSCEQYVFYPRPYCPNDMGTLEFTNVSGIGRVLSFTIVDKHANPKFTDHLPLVMAVVQLEEGPTMLTRLIGVEPSRVSFNQKVKVVIEKVAEEHSLPFFTPYE
jgi:uncharacterized protein